MVIHYKHLNDHVAACGKYGYTYSSDITKVNCRKCLMEACCLENIKILLDACQKSFKHEVTLNTMMRRYNKNLNKRVRCIYDIIEKSGIPNMIPVMRIVREHVMNREKQIFLNWGQ